MTDQQADTIASAIREGFNNLGSEISKLTDATSRLTNIVEADVPPIRGAIEGNAQAQREAAESIAESAAQLVEAAQAIAEA